MQARHDLQANAFAPEALEQRVLMSFTAVQSELSRPITDSGIGSVVVQGLAGFVQEGTEHTGYQFSIINDGAPGEVSLRTYLSLDNAKSNDDVLVQQTASVLIQNGQLGTVPATNEETRFVVPELPDAFAGALVYSIVEIVDSQGVVQQTLISERPAYVNPTQAGRIDLVDPSRAVLIENALADHSDDSRNRSGTLGGDLGRDFSLSSATNQEDPRRIFAGSEVSLTGSVYLISNGESLTDRTGTLSAVLVGADGSVTEIHSGTFTTSTEQNGRRRRRGGGSAVGSERLVTIPLSVLEGSNNFVLPSTLSAGLYTLRLDVSIDGQTGTQSISTLRPDVFIGNEALSDFWWENRITGRSQDASVDPSGPGFLHVETDDEPSRSGDDSSHRQVEFTFSADPRDLGRVAEDRLEDLLSEGRLRFALVLVSAGANWVPDQIIEIFPNELRGAFQVELNEPGEFDALFVTRDLQGGGEVGTELKFKTGSLGNTVDLPAGTYRFAALITNTESDASDGPVGVETRYSTDPSDPEYTNNLYVSAETITLDQGASSQPSASDSFIESFHQRFGQGLADGDSVRDDLLAAVPGAAYSKAPWTAENYWFQDTQGNVWSLWHGGAVHEQSNGEHNWVLTNLAEAGGLIGQIAFEPGSMSGVIASWQAFSIQGVAQGQLVSLWWSPESLRLEWGNRSNGWVLTPFTSDVFKDPATGASVGSLPRFRGYTETQSNGRYTFDPRDSHEDRHGGMSIVLVDDTGAVYVATFSTLDQDDGVPTPERANEWLLERLDDVPGLERHHLGEQLEDFRNEFRVRSNRGRG